MIRDYHRFTVVSVHTNNNNNEKRSNWNSCSDRSIYFGLFLAPCKLQCEGFFLFWRNRKPSECDWHSICSFVYKLLLIVCIATHERSIVHRWHVAVWVKRAQCSVRCAVKSHINTIEDTLMKRNVHNNESVQSTVARFVHYWLLHTYAVYSGSGAEIISPAAACVYQCLRVWELYLPLHRISITMWPLSAFCIIAILFVARKSWENARTKRNED